MIYSYFYFYFCFSFVCRSLKLHYLYGNVPELAWDPGGISCKEIKVYKHFQKLFCVKKNFALPNSIEDASLGIDCGSFESEADYLFIIANFLRYQSTGIRQVFDVVVEAFKTARRWPVKCRKMYLDDIWESEDINFETLDNTYKLLWNLLHTKGKTYIHLQSVKCAKPDIYYRSHKKMKRRHHKIKADCNEFPNCDGAGLVPGKPIEKVNEQLKRIASALVRNPGYFWDPGG